MNFFNKFNKLGKIKINYKKIFIVIGIILICVVLVVLNKNKSRAIFKFDGTGTTINSVVSGEDKLDKSGANVPVLASNMIPVYYDSTSNVWRKADGENKNVSYQWYDYNSKTWANAVTVTSTNRDTYLKASVGTEVSMSDINTMWVWIPRFNATGDTTNYNGGTIDAPGAFNITFVDTDTTAHDAFTFGSDQISGFWMGKFETTGSVSSTCTSETCDVSTVTILPNSASLISNSVSSYFYMSRSMEISSNPYGFDKTVDTTLDTHMLKNNEWGAVAYLTQSIYGRCTSSTSCVEVTENSVGESERNEDTSSKLYKNYNISLLATSNCSTSSISTGACDYVTNVNQSTTGNIYGVYDMSGGAYEYVMGIYKPSTLSEIKDYSGFSSTTSNSQYDKLPDAKYYNVYTTESAYTNAGLQHALTETSGWYGDYSGFVSSSDPWFRRGAGYSGGDGPGVFAHIFGSGNGDVNFGSRFALVK